ncbi:MAG: hypothetical protein LBB47_04030, partial [Spirochaetaceae bacterium]|nr:hypothetical protein [Spirochaetaceae bacterium]
MGKKNRRIKVMLPVARTEKKLCPYCSSGDGGKKEIYDSSEAAMDAAEYIKKERGVLLKIYKCPYETGWHLTKDNTVVDPENHKRRILLDNGIPLSPAHNSRVSWEYVEEKNTDAPEVRGEKTVSGNTGKLPPGKPEKTIVRIEARKNGKNIQLEGRVVEIVKNISIENIFKIKLDNLFQASI